MTPVADLLARLASGGRAGTDAALVLGLLLERETVTRPPADDGGPRLLLPAEWRQRRLDPAETQQVVDALLDHVRGTPVPDPTAVWALGKSLEPRIVPPLVDLLHRVLADGALDDLAQQAFGAVVVAAPGSGYEADVLAVAWAAAKQAPGDVAEVARDYLLAQP